MISNYILGIDPGTSQSAYVLWDGEEILQHEILENWAMLRYLEQSDVPHSDRAIERIACMGMAVGDEVFETAIWSGRFDPCCKAKFIRRHEIKMHFCQNPRAKDSNIRQALIDRLGVPGTKKKPGATYGIKADEWQALAVAVCAWDKYHDPPF